MSGPPTPGPPSGPDGGAGPVPPTDPSGPLEATDPLRARLDQPGDAAGHGATPGTPGAAGGRVPPRAPEDPVTPDGPRSGRTGVAAYPPAPAVPPGPLRTFLTSHTGGGLVALASVLLVVVVLLAVRPAPSGTHAAPGPLAGRASGPGGRATEPGGRTSGSVRLPPARGTAPTGAPATRHPVATPPRPVQPAVRRLPLTVLNDTMVHGLAHRAAETFTSAGWPVATVGNYAGLEPTTTVYYTPGHSDEQRAAAALARQFPRITRVLPHDPHLPVGTHGVIVVLAPDWLG